MASWPLPESMQRVRQFDRYRFVGELSSGESRPRPRSDPMAHAPAPERLDGTARSGGGARTPDLRPAPEAALPDAIARACIAAGAHRISGPAGSANAAPPPAASLGD
jgi:hypothetical protein